MGGDETREETILVRLTPTMKRILREQAGSRDLNQSEYVRQLIREDRDRNPAGPGDSQTATSGT